MKELSSPGFSPDPVPWLKRQTESGKITCYTDGGIVDLLAGEYGKKAASFYVELLEKSCNAFETSFFQEHYGELRLLSFAQMMGGREEILPLLDNLLKTLHQATNRL